MIFNEELERYIQENYRLEFKEPLDDFIKQKDISFSQEVIRLIDEKGYTDVECYKRAGIDKSVFSKLRSNISYRPSKQTALAICIGLMLNVTEANSLLKKAGYYLSHSSVMDLIVEFYIKTKNYDIIKINESLYEHKEPILTN